MVKFMIIIGFMWLLQVVLTFFQISNVKKVLRELNRTGNVGVGTVKGKMGAGTIVVLSGDREGRIIDAQVMSGVTVFARFRKIKEWIGLHYREIPDADRDDKNLFKALQIARDNLSALY